MKSHVEKSQQSLEIDTALREDAELVNEHMYPNAPEGNVESEQNTDVIKPKEKRQAKKSREEPFNPSKSKFSLKKIIKWLAILSLVLSVGVAGIWVYANKLVLFPSDTNPSNADLIASIDESSDQPINRVSNPYITQRDLRELSSGIRRDFKEAMQEYGQGLDKIDNIERQMSSLRGKFNELQTTVMQQGSNVTTGVNDERYNELIDKLSEVDTSLKNASMNSAQIEALLKINKDRNTLENQFKNNDWNLRKRMEKVESKTGINPNGASKAKPVAQADKKNSSMYRASITSASVKAVPNIQKKIQYETVKIPSSKAVKWKNQHRWKIRMISTALTQIQNIDTGDKIQISEGVEVTGCGIVLAIDVADRNITTQHCIISTKGK
ncbi:MAG: flagellar biosynthesis chaperone FliJ [Oleiphilaceae bacterium]|jgi:flagellar biosynthesis chaperone FliJ